MKKLLLVFSIFIFAFVNGKSVETWEKLFSANSTDAFRCVREVPAGGYIAAGYTSNYSVQDTNGFVVRFDISGDTIWTFTYNGPLSKKDLFYKVIPTSDGGFALCGYTSSLTGISDDLLYIKLNSSGVQQWVKFYGGNGRERGQDIIQTPDNGFAIVGYTSSAPAQYFDAFLVRTESDGDTLWTKRYGASEYDDCNSVKILPDGGYILGGQSAVAGNLDQYLVRTNSAGTQLWSKRFGTPRTDNIDCVALLPDGFILAGGTNDSISDNGSLVRTDTGGVVLWSKSYGGSLPDDFHLVDTTSDGGFIACGTTRSYGPLNPNIWIMRTNSSGDSLWAKTFGGENHDHGYSATQTSDGGFIVAGYTSSFGFNFEEAYIIKTDVSGNGPNKLTYTTVLSILSPTATTCGAPNTQIKLDIRNFGNKSVADIPVTIQITGAITQTINQTFSASSDTVILSTTINTSSGGTFTFKCFTDNNNNVYPARNSFDTTFTINIAAAAPTVTNNSRCGNGTVALAASAPATIYWYNVPANGTSIFTGTTYTTPSISATTTYYVQTGIACPSARIPVIATVIPISANPITFGDSRCGPGILTLTATAPDSITWYTVPSGGSSVGSGPSFITPVLSSTTNYYAQARNGSCPSSRILTIATVGSPANDPVTTSNQNCGPGTVTLSATSNNPVVWFDSAIGGIQVGTGLTFVTPILNSTTTFYAQANNGCISNRVAAVATINIPPADPVVASDERCGPGILTLGANSVNSLIWYDAVTLGNQVGVGSSFTTPVISSTTIYYVQANNGICPSNRVAAAAIIHSLPQINLGADTIIIGTVFILDAGPHYKSYLWSTGDTTQTISVSTVDTYCVTVTDSNNCSNSDCKLVDITNAISEFSQNNIFAVYPNPTNGIITISYPFKSLDLKIELMNITGDFIKGFYTTNPDGLNLDLTSLAKGVYLLKLNTGSSSEIQKLVVQ